MSPSTAATRTHTVQNTRVFYLSERANAVLPPCALHVVSLCAQTVRYCVGEKPTERENCKFLSTFLAHTRSVRIITSRYRAHRRRPSAGRRERKMCNRWSVTFQTRAPNIRRSLLLPLNARHSFVRFVDGTHTHTTMSFAVFVTASAVEGDEQRDFSRWSLKKLF